MAQKKESKKKSEKKKKINPMKELQKEQLIMTVREFVEETFLPPLTKVT